MQEANIIELLKNSSAEIVVAAALACLITVLIKRSHKLSVKVFFITSFILGTVCCLALSLLTSQGKISVDSLKNAISAGSIAVTITAFVKKTVFLEKDDLKSVLEKLLSSIILSDNLDRVVEDILSGLSKTDQALTEDQLKAIIRENTSSLDEERLDAVCRIILDALNDQTKT